MAQSNEMIIFFERCRLLEDGKIKSTGQVVEVEVNGEKKQFEVPEEIHTYQTWRSLGYQVRKGEKAIAQFPIWKYSAKKRQDEETGEEIEMNGKCFMKMSSFFSIAQVDKMEKATA